MASTIIPLWPRVGEPRQPTLHLFVFLILLHHSSFFRYLIRLTAGISLLHLSRGTDSTSLWKQGLTFASELIYYGLEHLQCSGSTGSRCAQRRHPGLFFRSPWVKGHHDMGDNCAAFLTFLALIRVSGFCFLLFFLNWLRLCLTVWWWILGLLLINYFLECAFLLYQLTLFWYVCVCCIFHSSFLWLLPQNT